MPTPSIDAAGVTVPTVNEITTQILDGTTGYPGMRQIYGPDINVNPNSPDGQMVNIVAQGSADMYQLILAIANSFDPDLAVGVVLDQRCAINGVQRRGATYTLTNVNVTATQAVTIPGADTPNPFTIADGAGTKFVLITSYAFLTAGTQSLAFRAQELGEVEASPNTLTAIVTPTLGISATNNSDPITSLGLDEETDAALRVRRARSVSLPSKGFLEGLLGALLSIDGVTQAIVLENTTNATDGDGIPGHSIWVIVNGGADEEIAQAIYVKRNAGCGMYGGVYDPVTVAVPQVDGTTFDVVFSRPDPEPLWISFDATAITGSIDEDYIRNQILERLSYGINEKADASAIVCLVKSIAPNASISAEGVSLDNLAYSSLLAPTNVDNQFIIASERIIINSNPGPS